MAYDLSKLIDKAYQNGSWNYPNGEVKITRLSSGIYQFQRQSLFNIVDASVKITIPVLSQYRNQDSAFYVYAHDPNGAIHKIFVERNKPTHRWEIDYNPFTPWNDSRTGECNSTVDENGRKFFWCKIDKQDEEDNIYIQIGTDISAVGVLYSFGWDTYQNIKNLVNQGKGPKVFKMFEKSVTTHAETAPVSPAHVEKYQASGGQVSPDFQAPSNYQQAPVNNQVPVAVYKPTSQSRQPYMSAYQQAAAYRYPNQYTTAGNNPPGSKINPTYLLIGGAAAIGLAAIFLMRR